jgi:hypothetical protein
MKPRRVHAGGFFYSGYLGKSARGKVTPPPRGFFALSRTTGLVETYIAALPGTVVSIVASADRRRSRFETGPPPADAIVHARLRFKESHAELVLSACGVRDWADMPPTSLLQLITDTAENLGARPRSDDDVAAAAKEAVAVVVAKVEAMNQNGGLKQINAAYKRYRLGQVAKGEKAISYSAHLTSFKESLVVQVAKLSACCP